jgi:hypothetical protein
MTLGALEEAAEQVLAMVYYCEQPFCVAQRTISALLGLVGKESDLVARERARLGIGVELTRVGIPFQVQELAEITDRLQFLNITL